MMMMMMMMMMMSYSTKTKGVAFLRRGEFIKILQPTTKIVQENQQSAWMQLRVN